MSLDTPTTTDEQAPAPDAVKEFVPRTWTGRLRKVVQRKLPYEQMLPETQPSYVASWIYVFGIATIAALFVIIASGTVLTFRGPMWWHTSSIGHYVNSLHFWSVQLFFLFMVVHMWGKFWMAAWRGNRARTWMTGVVAFLVSLGAGLTGYLIQTNFDSQWIAFEAKDGINAAGAGSFFNVTDFGQMLMMHVFLFPGIIALLVIAHVIYVRLHGVVPPIDAALVEERQSAAADVGSAE